MSSSPADCRSLWDVPLLANARSRSPESSGPLDRFPKAAASESGGISASAVGLKKEIAAHGGSHYGRRSDCLAWAFGLGGP